MEDDLNEINEDSFFYQTEEEDMEYVTYIFTKLLEQEERAYG